MSSNSLLVYRPNYSQLELITGMGSMRILSFSWKSHARKWEQTEKNLWGME